MESCKGGSFCIEDGQCCFEDGSGYMDGREETFLKIQWNEVGKCMWAADGPFWWVVDIAQFVLLYCCQAECLGQREQ